MMKFSVGIFLVLFSLSAHALRVVSAGKEFKGFFQEFNPSKSEQNFNAWLEFEEKFSDIYSSVIFRRSVANWDQHKKIQLNRFFTSLPKLSSQMMPLFDQAEGLAQAQVARIQKKIKDFNSNITIYFLPSALTFNALVTSTSADISHYILIIGVDGVAFWKSDLDVLFSHELFHMYHMDKAGIASDLSSSLAPLWKEGMATYFSHLENPNKDLSAILMDDEVAKICKTSEDLRQLAKSFLPYLNQTLTPEKQNELIKEWFWQDSKRLPHRQGYCLGYRLVEKIAKKNPFEEMILWGDLTFSEELAKALKEMAQ